MRFLATCPFCGRSLPVEAPTAAAVRIPDHIANGLMRPCPGVGQRPVKVVEV